VEDDPGAPFFDDTTKYVVSATLANADVEELEARRAVWGVNSPQTT
jgi:hypothetical protein